jgi:hypothetical protein
MTAAGNTQWSPPVVAGRQLPGFQTVAYLEKFGVVALTFIMIVYIIVRSLQRGPVAAMSEVSGLRR